jgi:hypothetical protein
MAPEEIDRLLKWTADPQTRASSEAEMAVEMFCTAVCPVIQYHAVGITLGMETDEKEAGIAFTVGLADVLALWLAASRDWFPTPQAFDEFARKIGDYVASRAHAPMPQEVTFQ